MLMNIISFYFGWWAIAYLGSRDHSWEIPSITIILLIVHLYLNKMELKKEILTILLISILGICFDLTMHFSNLFTLQKNYSLWLPSIWLLFSCTLRHSFKKILELPALFIFFISGIGGPFSYYVAHQFNLLRYPLTTITLIVHAIAWGIFIILTKFIIRKINEKT